MSTPTYTTAAKIASLLQYTKNDPTSNKQIRFEFDATSLPTLDEVNEWILEAEDDIDDITRKSWRLNTLTRPEYHDYRSKQVYGRYVDRSGRRIYQIRFNNQDIRTIDGGEGDKIEIWDGNQWIDFVAEKTLGQAMYEDDYYIDYGRNSIFLFNSFPIPGSNTIRLTYRWGLAIVPKSIQRICTWIVGADINERYEMYREVNKDTSPAMNLAERWRKLAMNGLEYHKFDEPDVI
jgi:hypothetical protein